MKPQADKEAIKRVAHETLTLEQLEACVRGELQAVQKGRRLPVLLWLAGPDLAEYEAAKSRGWLLWRYPGWRVEEPLQDVWYAFCRLTRRPYAHVQHAPRRKTVYLCLRLPEGDGLSESAVDRVHAVLLASVRKGHVLAVHTNSLFAQLGSLEEANVLTQQLLDLVQELAVPEPRLHVYKPKTGKSHRYPAPKLRTS